MSRTIIHPTRRHPLTGLALRAIGVLPNGKVVWPIMGGDDTIPPAATPPEGVTEEEWAALGDPGKRALTREREARHEAERKAAAAHARPTPPKSTPPAAPAATATSTDAQPDIAKLIQDGIAAAIKPFQEAETARTSAASQASLHEAIRKAATSFHDPDDAVAHIDTAAVTVDGAVDETKLTAALAALGEKRPHLVRDPRRFAPAGAGAQRGGGGQSVEDRTKESLARMTNATGIKFGA